jgi:hypothetical protein
MPHYDGVKKGGKESAVIGIFGQAPIEFKPTDPTKPPIRGGLESGTPIEPPSMHRITQGGWLARRIRCERLWPRISALGHARTLKRFRLMSALPPKADIHMSALCQ